MIILQILAWVAVGIFSILTLGLGFMMGFFLFVGWIRHDLHEQWRN